jgi:hypothetical protein
MNWKFFTEKLSWLFLCCHNFPGRSEKNHYLSKLPHKRFAPEEISTKVGELAYSSAGCNKLRFNKHNRS